MIQKQNRSCFILVFGLDRLARDQYSHCLCVYCQHRRRRVETDEQADSPTCCRAAWPGTACTRDRPAAWWCWTTRTCRKTAWPENRTSVFSAAEGWIVLKFKRNQMNTPYTRTNWGRAKETPVVFGYYARAYFAICALILIGVERLMTVWALGFKKFFFIFFFLFVFNGETPAVSSPPSARAYDLSTRIKVRSPRTALLNPPRGQRRVAVSRFAHLARPPNTRGRAHRMDSPWCAERRSHPTTVWDRTFLRVYDVFIFTFLCRAKA